ncbi:SDR family oxidoreductase [Hymenobacter sp. GOD-10R]|uniref:SDR family oxidoreductase n=1 Tax=Hymenobacter sp. GOD-10R TaxID=3093922 RepID=UPI002D76A23C|nr:SDR family oxidoreductase [Hymenobacter sp. GOD-10R]WRQ30535.1 SDR family oxidoreductase [Hymenobacter sp. GOD-10R]
MLAITGATGHLGRATINALLSKTSADKIVALVRDPQKATDLSQQGVQVRQGDYNDLASLEAAFQGVNTVLLISGDDLAARTQQHKNVIDAAKSAGVKHVIYTSVVKPSRESHFPASPSHVDTEEYLAASGLTYTLFRNALYLDFVPMIVGQDAVPSGKIFSAAGDGKVSYALRNDIAEALANVLTSSGHENKTYDISLGTAYSIQDVATALSDVTGKTIEVVSISGDDMAAGMRQHHVPEPIVSMMVGMTEAMKQNEFDVPSATFEQLLGHKPTDLKPFLTSVYSK